MPISDQINQLVARLMPATRKKAVQEIVAIDFDPRGAACVRMKRSGENIAVIAADILPAAELTFSADPSTDVKRGSYALPRHMLTRHVAICLPGEDAIVKLLSFPGELNNEAENQIKALMGVEEGDFRIAYKVLSHARGRSSETKLLTLAFPSAHVAAAVNMFPVGVPAPISVEVSEMAAMTAFLRGSGGGFAESAVGIIEIGVRAAFLVFFNKGQLALIRKFDFGYHDIMDAVQRGLGVDAETAMDIIADGSFDISHLIKGLSEPFIKQLVISKHFVERREDCHVEVVCVPEGVPRDWLKEIDSAMAVEARAWNPFDGLDAAPDALSDEHKKTPSRFSAAVGAGLAVFEETSA